MYNIFSDAAGNVGEYAEIYYKMEYMLVWSMLSNPSGYFLEFVVMLSVLCHSYWAHARTKIRIIIW